MKVLKKYYRCKRTSYGMTYLMFVFCILFSSYSLSAQDLSGNLDERRKAAERYLKIFTAADQLQNTMEEIAKTIREDQREEFMQTMTASIDYERLEKMMLDSLVRFFTLEELNVMTDFYGSETGRSIRYKLGKFTAGISPFMQEEVEKAYIISAKNIENKNKVRLSVIQVGSKPEAESILRSLMTGADFGTLAKERSIGPAKEEGGDLGFMNPDDMVESLGAYARKLSVNQISGIVETSIGFFILKRTE